MILPPQHARLAGRTNDWITPKWLIDRLGPFDLDTCACTPQPWRTAARQLTVRDDGLTRPWGRAFVWLNPPYGRQLIYWLRRMAEHNDGIALTFARTDTRAFHRHVWPVARTMVFLKGRLTFWRPDGCLAANGHNSGGPSVLIGYGGPAGERLRGCGDLGAVVRLT